MKTSNSRSQITWQEIFKELAPHDPRGPFTLSMAQRFFAQKLVAEFREWLENECLTWRESPSAQLLVGKAYALEGNTEESIRSIDQAEALWTRMDDDGYLTPDLLESIRYKLDCCRKTVKQPVSEASGKRLMECFP